MYMYQDFVLFLEHRLQEFSQLLLKSIASKYSDIKLYICIHDMKILQVLTLPVYGSYSWACLAMETDCHHLETTRK